MTTARLIVGDQEYELPVVDGVEGDRAIDVSKLRSMSGLITLDNGFSSTGSCVSKITYIDGENGVLRYCGYPIEQLAEQADFTEVAWLLLNGELPNQAQLAEFNDKLTSHSMIHEDMKKFFEGYPPAAHPMAILSSMVASLSTYYPVVEDKDVEDNIIRLLAKASTIAAQAYKKSIGHPTVYPQNNLNYCENFLNMMFSVPTEPYEMPPVLVKALNTLLILHADHEQNCSTSTVRLVGSSKANLFASVAAGISALSGPLHGGANQRVLEMLQTIADDGADYQKYVDFAKDKTHNFRLMGFGHRVYKNFDPRARILCKLSGEVLDELGIDDPLLNIAKKLEEVALKDEYFVKRRLYPNVDFYSGILYRAMGIPINMFTVMFALGRLPGWVAHWKELRNDPNGRIGRPRQVYAGSGERDFVSIDKR